MNNRYPKCSELDGHRVYSRSDGGVWLIPESEPYREWRAVMWSTTDKGKRIYNDLCSPGTPEGKADLMEKVKRSKGWSVSSIALIQVTRYVVEMVIGNEFEVAFYDVDDDTRSSGERRPVLFESIAEAQKEIDDCIKSCEEAVKMGNMDTSFRDDEYNIREATTKEIYGQD